LFDEKSGKLKYDVYKSGDVGDVNKAKKETDKLATEAFKQIAGSKGSKEEYFKSLFSQFLKDNNIKGYTGEDVKFFVDSIRVDKDNKINPVADMNFYRAYPPEAISGAEGDIRGYIRTRNNAAYNKYAQIMDLFRQYLIDVL